MKSETEGTRFQRWERSARLWKLSALLLLNGCVIPIFPHGINPEQLQTIRVGSTSREEVVKLFGEAKALNHDRFSVYDLASSKGGVIILIAGGFVGGGIPKVTQRTRSLPESEEADGGTASSAQPWRVLAFNTGLDWLDVCGMKYHHTTR